MKKVEWNTTDPDFFQIGARAYDVRLAKQILSAKKLPRFNTMAVKDLLVLMNPREKGKFKISWVNVNWESIAEREDLDHSVPIVVVQDDSGIFPIEGYNRIAKAHLEGLKEVPIAALSKVDTKKITRRR